MRAPQKDFIYDHSLLLKDAGLVAADAAATVDSSARVIDLGDARFDGRVIVDVTAVEVADNNELFHVIAQFSDSATFASGIVNGPALVFGAFEVTKQSADSATGRYELPVTNEILGATYRYMRLWTEVAGTVGTGIHYSAFLTTEA